MSILYVGLDFEASGSNPWDKHVPIQLGMSIMYRDPSRLPYFNGMIGGWNWREFEWSEEAEQVHGINRNVVDQQDPVWQVDVRAANWLLDQGWTNRMFTVPVGWNVAGYDRQFITRWMPNLNRMLSYRSVDLNAPLFVMSGSEAEYVGRKESLKKETETILGLTYNINPQWHDAVYDAQAALVTMDLMRTKE